VGADGKEVKLDSPYGDELPQKGFDAGADTYQAPPEPSTRSSVKVRVRERGEAALGRSSRAWAGC
jgi:aconitate hydratase